MQNFHKIAFEETDTAIFMSDPCGQCLAVNPRAISLTGYATRFLHPEDRHLVGQEIGKSLETPDPDFNRKVDHRILYADGRIGHISVHYFVEKDQQGRTIKIYGINQDITDRKQAEEERRKLRDHVRQTQKMESIGLLAGGVAHDFNKPFSLHELSVTIRQALDTEPEDSSADGGIAKGLQ